MWNVPFSCFPQLREALDRGQITIHPTRGGLHLTAAPD
jgi:hypothetical protein